MIQELNLQENDQEIHILVIRSARKSLGLEVRDQNTVLARIPARLPDRELKQFVETHREWILKKTRIAAQREENRKATPAPPLEITWDRESGHVFMTGPAVEVFSGEIDLGQYEM